MKPRFLTPRTQAFTLIELMVVIAVLAIFFAMMDFGVPVSAKNKAKRIHCVNNLKQVGIASQIWAGDHNHKYPLDCSIADGGAMDVTAAFQIMSNELITPKILYCLADTNRVVATNFHSGFSTKNISYFVGLDAGTNLPQAVFSGDDNFEISGAPVKAGLLAIPTHSTISWTTARHKLTGNILLNDGSVKALWNSNLTSLFQETGFVTNRFVIP